MKKLLTNVLFLAISHFSYAKWIIPFELYEDKFILIKLPAPDNKDSLVFYFDTGASTTLLDKKVAERLQLKPDFKQNVPGASGSKSYDIVTNQQLQIAGDIYIRRINLVLEDLTRLNNNLGRRFDGIIGNDIIRNFQTKIDFGKKEIELNELGDKFNTTGYSVIDFIFKNGIPIPQFPISIQLQNGDSFSGDILFDSGAGLLLMMNTPFINNNNLLDKIGKTVVSSSDNLSGKTVSTHALISRLGIGEYSLTGKLPVSLSSDKEGVSAYKGYLGILGSDIINRFDIILDYAAHKLYIKPNYLFKKAFELPVSPIKLAYADKGIVITTVIEKTDAWQQGLREGQQLVSINGIEGAKIETYRKLLSAAGTEVNIKVVDGGKVKEYTLQLKELL
jgi:hypothetical protein